MTAPKARKRLVGPGPAPKSASLEDSKVALSRIFEILGPTVEESARKALSSMEDEGGYFMPDVYEFVVRFSLGVSR